MSFAVEQEKGNFKGRVFGGFNRKDVIDYIESLAAERNDLALENRKLSGRVEALEEKLEELRQDGPASSELPDQEELVRARAEQVIENARGILSDVRRAYEELCGDIGINVSQADHELKTASSRLTALQDTLKNAGERLSALDTELDIMPLDGQEAENAGSL